jgi:hypothetical protein
LKEKGLKGRFKRGKTIKREKFEGERIKREIEKREND